jgi:hypothetical protein
VVNARFFAPTVISGLFFVLASPVLAQEATPAGAGGKLDLVAMALSAGDLPPGYVRFWGGVLAPGEVYGDVFASHLSRERLAETGHIRSYEDNYGVWNSGEFVHIFIDEYASAEGAAKGFEIFEDESNAPPDETVLSMEDRPLPGVGEEPSELTLGTVVYEDGTFSQFVGSAFRIGNLNAGVVLEYLTFPDESGTPVATPVPIRSRSNSSRGCRRTLPRASRRFWPGRRHQASIRSWPRRCCRFSNPRTPGAASPGRGMRRPKR